MNEGQSNGALTEMNNEKPRTKCRSPICKDEEIRGKKLSLTDQLAKPSFLANFPDLTSSIVWNGPIFFYPCGGVKVIQWGIRCQENMEKQILKYKQDKILAIEKKKPSGTSKYKIS